MYIRVQDDRISGHCSPFMEAHPANSSTAAWIANLRAGKYPFREIHTPPLRVNVCRLPYYTADPTVILGGEDLPNPLRSITIKVLPLFSPGSPLAKGWLTSASRATQELWNGWLTNLDLGIHERVAMATSEDDALAGAHRAAKELHLQDVV
jgi:hypothetical protein